MRGCSARRAPISASRWQSSSGAASLLRSPIMRRHADCEIQWSRASTLPAAALSKQQRQPASSPLEDVLAPALGAVELVALSSAAATQAAIMLSDASAQLQAARQAQTERRGARRGGDSATPLAADAPPHIALLHEAGRIVPPREDAAALQGFSVVVALGCGALLRRLQALRLHGGTNTTTARINASASARLVALEAAVTGAQAQLSGIARTVEKAGVRSRVASADARAPLAALHEANARHAELLRRLADGQDSLSEQLEGSRELIDALRAVAAKQFDVTVAALEALRRTQRGAAGDAEALAAELARQAVKVEGLEVRLAASAAVAASAVGGGSSSGSSIFGTAGGGGGSSIAGLWGSGSSSPAVPPRSVPGDPWASHKSTGG